MKALPRILAVDDSELNREILMEILEDEFELACTSSGEECLEIVERFRPDIILLDIMMPGMDGYEVCKRVRANPTLCKTKVIMLSAKAMVSERMSGYEAGANDYITKPFDKRELLAKIRIFLDLKSTEELREARLAGMAEVAVGVLHNVGNVLNSINVSASRARSCVGNQHVKSLSKVAELCCSHEDDLPRFVSEDKRGRALPTFLREVSTQLMQDQVEALDELGRLEKNIDHVKRVISVQQNHARCENTLDPVSLEDLIDEALQLVDCASLASVQLQKEIEEVAPVWTDQNKTIQILVNMISNACDAVRDLEPEDRRVVVQLNALGDGQLQVAVRDNGVGIRMEDSLRIFQHGFTTKEDGHGFGLHCSAIAARELGGSMSAHSDGEGQGATFALRLPIEVPEDEAA